MGSFHCACDHGYALQADKTSCFDVDECQTSNGGCEQDCENYHGSFKCSCRSGYNQQQVGKYCIDIDECVSDARCSQTCINTNGSFHCACDPGYVLQADNNKLKINVTDLDECLLSNGGCEQECENTPGSFRCSCRSGFKLHQDGKYCIDVNECDEGVSGCSDVCHNTVGSYTCLCNEGFELAANGHSCNNIDECGGFLNGGCEDKCLNTIGSFHCACSGNSTLLSDGFSCSGANEQSPGFFSRHGLVSKLLPKGCYTIPLSSCGSSSTLNISLSSTAKWYRLLANRNIVYTFGITFVEVNALALPISISGIEVHFDEEEFKIISGSMNYQIKDGITIGNERTSDCWRFDITPRDIVEIIKSLSFTRTFFENLQKKLPDWLQFSQSGTEIIGINNLKACLLTGSEINRGPCKGAPLVDNRHYTLFTLKTELSINLYGQNITCSPPLENREFCFIIDNCQDYGNTFFFILPESSRDILSQLSFTKKLQTDYGITLSPIGVGMSLQRDILVDWKTSTTEKGFDLQFWNGEGLFRYPIQNAGNVWVAGEASLRKSIIHLEGKAFAYVAVPSLKNILRSIFFGEWHIGVHFTATSSFAFQFKVFGKTVDLDLKFAVGSIDAYGSVGGMIERSWCGPHANPSGFFATAIVNLNPFQNIPILSFIKLKINTRLYASLFTDPTRDISQSDNVHLFKDIIDFKEVVSSFLNVTVKTAFRYTSLLTNESLFLLEEISSAGDHFYNLMHEFEHKLEGKVDVSFVMATEDNTRIAKLNFTDLFYTEINTIESNFNLVVGNSLHKFVNLYKHSDGFGLRFEGEIIIAGLRLFGLEIEMFYSTNHLQTCDNFVQSPILRNEKAVRFLGLFTIRGRSPIPFLKVENGYGLQLALSTDYPGRYEAIFEAKASILGLAEVKSEIIISNYGMQFYLEGKIWQAFKAQLDVSYTGDLDLTKNAIHTGISFSVKGRFVADANGDGDFSDSYLSALTRFTSYIADEADKRISSVQNAFSSAQNALSAAEDWIEEKKRVLRSANIYFDNAIRAMDNAKQKLEDAKIPLRHAMDKLNEAQRKVDRLCTIKHCSRVCVPGLSCRICHKKVWFVNIPYPCCHFTSCMFSLPNPFCAAANLACYALRGIAYGALEIAKFAVRIPMAALDVAKVAVSSAQFVVDKSSAVLLIAEGALTIAQVGLEAAKSVMEAANLALEAVKAVVRLGINALNFIIKYGIGSLIDVRNCGFELDIVTRSAPVFDVHCEVNAFNSGFKPVQIRINFNNIVQSIWNSAKATIEAILESIGNILGRKRREMEHQAIYGLHRIIRSAKELDLNGTEFEAFANQSIDTIFRTSGFQNTTSDSDYDVRKEIYAEKCDKFTNAHTFFEEAIDILFGMVNETATTLSNASTLETTLSDFNLDDISSNISVESMGIDPDIALNEFNISISDLHESIESTKANFSTDPLLSNIDAFANEAGSFLHNQTESTNKILIVNQWINAMNNLSSQYYDVDVCVSFLDCSHYAITLMYELYMAENITNQDESLASLSEFEDIFLLLTGNGSHTINDVHILTSDILDELEIIKTLNMFCSEAPGIIDFYPNISAVQGEKIILICNASGEPTPTFAWYKDDEIIDGESEMVLEIANSSIYDAGLYH
ncbi:HMCN1-like protein, partial [Mya arenaria]